MDCIYCKHKTKVTNSRPQKADYQTWRRRQCLSCHAIITSIESIDLANALRVKKKNGSYQPFQRDKLFLSIYKAVDHLENPAETAHHLSATILRHIIKADPLSPVVPSETITIYSAKVLKNYNAAASVRYMSFQANMQLPNDIRRTLK